MGHVRAVCVALALVFAGAATSPLQAARPRGVRVARVVRLDDSIGGFREFLDPALRFDSRGNLAVLEQDGDEATLHRVGLDGTPDSVAPIPPLSRVSWDADALYEYYGGALVRVGTDDVVTTTRIDGDAGLPLGVVRDGKLYTTSSRIYDPDPAIWWRRRSLDGTPDGPSVRVTPPGPVRLPVQIECDADGTMFVVWTSGGCREYDCCRDQAVHWQRVDPDGAVSAPVTLFTFPDGAPAWWSTAALGPDGTLWIIPAPESADGAASPYGLIGIRRDGVVLPVGGLLPVPDSAPAPYETASLALDAAGGARVILTRDVPAPLPSDPTRTERRTNLFSFAADGEPLRSTALNRLVKRRRDAFPSTTRFRQIAVAPDGTSLVPVFRADADGRGVLEYLHLDAAGRVLGRGSFTPACFLELGMTAATQVAGRPRFAVAWTARATRDGPRQSFVAVLE